MLLLAAVVGAAVFVWFVVMDRRRPETVVYIVVGLMIVDAVIYTHQGSVPIGLFRPKVLGQDLRLVDVVVPVALAARLVVRGLPRRATAEGLVWLMFFGWYGFAGLVGLARDQPFELVLFQWKFLVHTGGVMILIAGVPMSKLADRRLLERTAVVIGWPVLAMLPLAVSDTHFAIPGLRGARIGTIAPDAATILFAVGVLVIVGTASRTPSWSVVVGAGAMLCAPLVADQRAVLVGAIPTAIVIAIAMTGPVWRHRSPIRPATLVPLIAAMLVPVGIGLASAAESGESLAAAAPVIGRLEETFGSEQKQQSGEIRVGLLREGRRLAFDRPVVGQGLGQQVAILRGTSGDPAQRIGDFHNVMVDLAVRAGFSGLALFLLALLVTFGNAIKRWSSLASDAHACLVLAAGAALSGLVAKGLFETVFQKYRLAVLMGVLLGILAASANAPTLSHTAIVRRREPQWT